MIIRVDSTHFVAGRNKEANSQYPPIVHQRQITATTDETGTQLTSSINAPTTFVIAIE